MDTGRLRRFAQYARKSLLEQVENRLGFVLAEGSLARRESAGAVKKLEDAIESEGREQVVERVAYIWFNRFCALRFMDVNRYNRILIVSPLEGHFQPEILEEAKAGHIDEEIVPETKKRERILGLLSGSVKSDDGQGEAYGLLVIAACNYWNGAMPFLFEKIDDYTELLIPLDLLSGNSILAYTREAMMPDSCKDVEVIGWLYQYYISEKKDAVFAGLKKNKKITPENIPAATQLFTPNWIVRYMVDNSLGRLWMLNRPDSKLADEMDYYIAPEEYESEYLRVSSPEELTVCDPACGSGHILTYAFDLLFKIYEEEGYNLVEIPELILKNNLYCLEVDERAGELAAFALTMKAREKDRRFFRREVQPNICVLENIDFEEGELKKYFAVVGEELFSGSLRNTLYQFAEVKNYGSLIQPVMTDVSGVIVELKKAELGDDLFIRGTHNKVMKVLEQVEYLGKKYYVVVANPPYMGGKGMNPALSKYAKDNYPDTKSDLFAMFMERGLELVQSMGYSAMVTMQSWMFLSSYEKFRSSLLNHFTLTSMAHLGARAFNSIGGEVVQTTSFVVQNNFNEEYKGQYLRLIDGKSEEEKQEALLEAVRDHDCGWFFRASAADFKKIPGSPIAYWVSDNAYQAFERFSLISELCEPKSGLSTTDNNRFLRYWYEVGVKNIGFSVNDILQTVNCEFIWYPFIKGGDYRKWYGNNEYVVNWFENGKDIKEVTKGAAGGRIVSPEYYFKNGVTWSGISSSKPSMRIICNAIFGSGGKALFSSNNDVVYLAFLNCKVALYYLVLLSPTLNYEAGHIGKLPFDGSLSEMSNVCDAVKKMIMCSNKDWNSYESSWDFESLSLLGSEYRNATLEDTYNNLTASWKETTLEMQKLEEENNRIFIDAYGLQDELTPDVPLEEITLTCNPYYRYAKGKTNAEYAALQLTDTIKEFVSYAVGCMFGRYSLDTPGLIIASQGETLQDYSLKLNEKLGWGVSTHENADPAELEEVTADKCSFLPDTDNIIPILDGDWFTDDIVAEFYKFLKVTFGEDRFEENLRFVEKALGKDIRKYFLKDFYKDHVKTYKKRPIYWLFSSAKGSFNALIYMHRYNPSTVSVILNDYLREFKSKLQAELKHQEGVSNDASGTKAEQNRADKALAKLKAILKELEEYERDLLYPLASEQIAIDLDDGVKVNYPKFGEALMKVVGLS